jgi:hypothetical protein
VAIGNVDGDSTVEIVTGGYYYEGTHEQAQLCVWDGSDLTLKGVTVWNWVSDTQISSVAIGDVDGDSSVEIVTGGYYYDGLQYVAQLCVWNGSDLTLKGVTTWYTIYDTQISSVAIGDVDGGGHVEIVTGGYYYDGLQYVAQLCVWDGLTLTQKDTTTWHWVQSTFVYSVAVGDVDADGLSEIITGGYYYDSIQYNAQLVVWGIY